MTGSVLRDTMESVPLKHEEHHGIAPLGETELTNIEIVRRDLTVEETAQMNSGFDQLSLEEGVELESSERSSFVASSAGDFVGCASGLAFKNGTTYSGWFLITYLYVVKESRSRGFGAELLHNLEARMRHLKIEHIFLWTSGDKALRFYRREGYRKFTEMENWYSDGSSRVGLRKDL